MYFFRKSTPSGMVTQLLESYRNADGQPRTRVVVSLGDLEVPEADRKPVAREVEARLYDRPLLLPPEGEAARLADRIVARVRQQGRWRGAATAVAPGPAEAEPAAPDPAADQPEPLPATVDGVILEAVSHSRATSLGPELLGLTAWRELGMPELLASLGFNPSQEEAACIQVVGRLVAPGSELGLADRFLDASSLPDLLGCCVPTDGRPDRFYRVSDKLMAHRGAIETHLRQTVRQRLGLQRTYYLYDLTNSHFEGLCQANPKAKRGNSKQKRHDCPLIAAGLCFDEHGFVLFHQTFPGNSHDATTLPAMVERMQQCGREDGLLEAPAIIVVDGGLASEANLAALREAGLRYLVNRTRSARGAYAEDFSDSAAFTPIPDRQADRQVLVRRIPHPDQDGDSLVLCHSHARGEKEQAIRSHAETRYLRDLDKLRDRIANGRLKAPDKIQQAIGRTAANHPRVSRYYTVALDEANHLTWQRADPSHDQAAALDGRYVLQTNIADQDAVALWQHYIILTRAEDGFRALKSHLGLRPNHHSLEHRVDGHIFITILAYQLLRYLSHQLERHGDHRSWPILRQILQTHCYATVTLPTTSGTTWTLRRPGQPEAAHRRIYEHLGIDLSTLPRTTTPVHDPRNP